ncbi:MAG: universal stress protein [Verrucomicrobia bacterium]|nr:universal stress protein [Verrucomicrobiota bacterium]
MKNILVAVDFSKNTDEVMAQAAALGKGLGAKLWIVHVTSTALQAAYESTQLYDFAPEFISAAGGDVELARDLCAEEYKREHQSLLNLSGKMREAGVDAQAMLLKGDAAALILEKAEDLDIDIIVMGSHGHGLLRKVLLGSVSEAVIRKAFCSVLIVPPPAE